MIAACCVQIDRDSGVVMMEGMKQETRETVTLEEILPVTRGLTGYDKLVLARILLEEALAENSLFILKPHTVIELYSPIEVSGDFSGFNAMLRKTQANAN